jgi:hypothetical protein
MNPELDNRIKELCAKAVAATDALEAAQAIKELNAALGEHTRRVRARLKAERERSVR